MKLLITPDMHQTLAVETKNHLDRIQAVSGDVEVFIPVTHEEVLRLMPRIDIIFGGIDRGMFLRAERLRWIQTMAAGADGFLFPEFVESEIVLTSGKGTVGVHLAEQAMALLLALTRGVAKAVRTKDWRERMPIRKASWELVDRTMGIVGLGGTGRALAVRASAFGMRILAVDTEDLDVPAYVEACWGIDRLDDLLALSDVVAICAPLTPATQGMFDRAAFEKMQSHALLINVTRGKIVEEESLLHALKVGWIGGAGLDCTPQEPLPRGHPLWDMENVVISPHTAGGSPNRGERILDLFCENLRRLIAGEPLLSQIAKKKGY